MPLKLDRTILLVVKWVAERGRTYEHRTDPEVCLTCEGSPVYARTCRQADHSKRSVKHTTLKEDAPEEAKRVQQLYGKLYRSFRSLGYALGDQVYLLGKDTPINEFIAKTRAEFDEANEGFKVCKAGFTTMVIEIVPGEAHAETLASLRASVEEAVGKLLDALHSGDVTQLKVAVRETKNLSSLLDGEAKTHVTELSRFTEKIAKRLKAAAEEGEAAVEKAVTEAKQGAIRFATVLAELTNEEAQDAETQTASA